MAIYQDGDGFGDFGFSLKKTFKKAKRLVSAPVKKLDLSSSKSIFGAKVAKFAKPVAKWVVKPMIASAAAITSGGATVIAGEKNIIKKDVFGVKPTAIGIAEGAIIGAAIAAAPIVTSSIAGGGGLTTTAVEYAKKEAIELAKKEAAGLVDKGADAAQALIGAGAQPSEVNAMTPAEQAAAVAVLKTPKSNTAPIIGAVLGFVVGGPLGAAAGGAAGYALTKE